MSKDSSDLSWKFAATINKYDLKKSLSVLSQKSKMKMKSSLTVPPQTEQPIVLHTSVGWFQNFSVASHAILECYCLNWNHLSVKTTSQVEIVRFLLATTHEKRNSWWMFEPGWPLQVAVVNYTNAKQLPIKIRSSTLDVAQRGVHWCRVTCTRSQQSLTCSDSHRPWQSGSGLSSARASSI